MSSSNNSASEHEQVSKLKKDFKFTTIGVLITVLGQPFREELFERVLHEHLPWRKAAMGVTETDGDKQHYHMVAVCRRPNMWLASNIEGQLGIHAHIEPLASPGDVVNAMAYLTKYQTPSVWAVTPVMAKNYKNMVLEFIMQKQNRANAYNRAHYARQYARTWLAFFPPEKEELEEYDFESEDPDKFFK